MVTAKVVEGAIAVEMECFFDGAVSFQTTCNDFDHYKTLPTVVSYKGVVCKKTGWNSDTNWAYYKQSSSIAYSK